MRRNRRLEEMVAPVCQRYGEYASPSESRFLVCENRKVSYLLSAGRISRPECFQAQSAFASFKNMPREALSTTLLLPEGFRVATIAKTHVYIGEIVFPKGRGAMFRFSRLNQVDTSVEAVSEEQNSPAVAFMQVQAEGERGADPNGKLLIAAFYSETQRMLRQLFEEQNALEAMDNDTLRQAYEKWKQQVPLGDTKVLSHQPALRRCSSSNNSSSSSLGKMLANSSFSRKRPSEDEFDLEKSLKRLDLLDPHPLHCEPAELDDIQACMLQNLIKEETDEDFIFDFEQDDGYNSSCKTLLEEDEVEEKREEISPLLGAVGS